MQNIEVTITLDPIKDGAVIKEKEFRRKNKGSQRQKGEECGSNDRRWYESRTRSMRMDLQ